MGVRLRVALLLLLLAVRCIAHEEFKKNCVSGYPGIPGDPGHNGMPGRDGRDGFRGDKGDRGEISINGPTGQSGPKEEGELGTAGLAGIKGKWGENGEKGPPGKMGPQGVSGHMGLKEIRLPAPGPKRDLGPLGPEGQKGEIGFQGERGIQGPLVPPGRPGPKGDLGPPGFKGNMRRRARESGGETGDKGEKGTSLIPKSAFSVGLTEYTKLPPANTPIRFDKVIYNRQNHPLRRFTCALAGAYYFTYHITVFSRNVKVALVRNGLKDNYTSSEVIHTMDNYTSSEDQAAGGAVLHLEKGDKVWLQVAGGELFNGLFADEDDDTTFSGFLLFGAD
ncbi:LOW QUALITY PROTEIN: complement C1q and tumor necrosis factor-related protein 9A [Salvelinus alpinus]